MDDFLQHFWGNLRLFLNEQTTITADESILAIIIATNAQNYDRFIALNEFKNTIRSLGLKANLYGTQTAQIGIINAIKSSKISRSKLLLSLKNLQDENILNKDEYKRISNFIISLNEQDELQDSDHTTLAKQFHQSTDILHQICLRLLDLDSEQIFTKRLKTAMQKMSELHFNIVVTGVINAGKSTMLNALLNARILGTSNVPETTNLTLLKHSDTPHAVVNFWSQSELRQLDIVYKTDINLNFKSLNIKLNELKNYTSATSEIAKFVKSVELFENLDILKDGICIVDTPGIDDAVFLREQLVREFMNECDLMIHLMNVSQSMTQKDIEFIKNSLHRSRIVRLIIVLTHTDLLSQDELNEVIAYTQKSIKNELNPQNNVKIELFSISAKRYFEGKNDSGIQSFKNHIYKIFFSADSEKSTLALNGYKNELTKICTEFLEITQNEKLNLNSSNLELSEKLEKLNLYENELNVSVKQAQIFTDQELSKIRIDELEKQWDLGLRSLVQSTKERILSEINFTKNSKKPLELKRINYIIQSSLNDGIIALMRQNRNAILSQIKSCADNIRLNFPDLFISLDQTIFSINEYLRLKNITFKYDKVCEYIDKFINSNELTNKVDKALSEFLQDEKIKGFAYELCEFEKDKFKELVAIKMNEKLEIFNKNKERLMYELTILKGQTNEAINELERLKNLELALKNIKMELFNV
ncbi:dynamin family protein [Campylobacter sp. faydin G-24]|uniref:Dynamin family protein n=1 Tax=Campylobacter anatolicus TaxID=2829105 RepID=A0ABS5HJ94_9BACT|nr:dynamin family protein [Campylobacter anatolicus]MBR8464344.1 dynamin family protein [Campylobacter anatolicus]